MLREHEGLHQLSYELADCRCDANVKIWRAVPAILEMVPSMLCSFTFQLFGVKDNFGDAGTQAHATGCVGEL